MLLSTPTRRPPQSLVICSQKEMSPDGPANVTLPSAWLLQNREALENLIHSSFPSFKVSFGSFTGHLVLFFNKAGYIVKSIIVLLIKNITFTFNGRGSE